MQTIRRYIIIHLNYLVNIDVSTRLSNYFKSLFNIFCIYLYTTNIEFFFINRVNQYSDIMSVIIYVLFDIFAHDNHDLRCPQHHTHVTCQYMNKVNTFTRISHVYTIRTPILSTQHIYARIPFTLPYL